MDFGAISIPTLLGIGGAAASKALTKPAQAPAVQKPAVMPTTDDAAVQAAKRRQAAELQSRSGRQSTILGGDERLGG